MADLTDRVRDIVRQHAERDRDESVGTACGCGAEGLSDHSRHVAEEIVNWLGLRPQYVNDARTKIRYVSASFDDELTKLEGAE